MQLVVNEETVLQFRDMSEEEFYDFCALNPNNRIERTAAGDIRIMPPTGLETSSRNMDLSEQLQRWARRDGRGIAFDSNVAFTLPNGAILSPDASWVLRSKLARLTSEEKKRFSPLCPDFVVELTSPSDRLVKVQEKMREWMANGTRLGWLLDADTRRVFVYRSSNDVEALLAPEQVVGEDPVTGFVLDLTYIWNPNW